MQKSKAKPTAKKVHIIQCMFYLYSASAAEGRPSFDSYLLRRSMGNGYGMPVVLSEWENDWDSVIN